MKKKAGWLKYALHAVVLLGVVAAGMKYINGDALETALRRFDWKWAPLIALLGLLSLLVKGGRFVTFLRELTPSSRWTVLKAYVAGQACAMLPGGVAARAGILEQAGVPVGKSAAAIALSSLSDQMLFFLCVLVSALWFEAARKPALIFLAGLTVVSILLGIQATRRWLLHVIEKLLGRFHLEKYWRGFVDSARHLATPALLLGGLAKTACAFALLVLALFLACRGVGAGVGAGGVPWSTLLIAFTLPTMLGRISAMPGGVGVTEAGMVGILDHAKGVTLDQAAAAVLVFRTGTVLLPALFGGLVYGLAWHGSRERRRSTADAATTTVAAPDVPALREATLP